MTLSALTAKIKDLMLPLWGTSETAWYVRIIFSYLKGWSYSDILLRQDEEVSDFIAERALEIASEVGNGRPIQYVIGETYWHGMNLKVSPAVLIPRPETSQLVDIFVERYRDQPDLKVLDMCTGSGCIAIALAKELKFARVSGCDISEEALTIARENGKLQKVKVDFFEADVTLPFPLPDGSFDVVVSNPPYVLENEKEGMVSAVKDHEPHIALFVPDSDPLKFYQPIAMEAFRLLKTGGMLFFEINPLSAGELVSSVKNLGFTDVTILRDFAGKERFLTAIKP